METVAFFYWVYLNTLNRKISVSQLCCWFHFIGLRWVSMLWLHRLRNLDPDAASAFGLVLSIVWIYSSVLRQTTRNGLRPLVCCVLVSHQQLCTHPIHWSSGKLLNFYCVYYFGANRLPLNNGILRTGCRFNGTLEESLLLTMEESILWFDHALNILCSRWIIHEHVSMFQLVNTEN